jgi:ribose transport system substrate-binding protein
VEPGEEEVTRRAVLAAAALASCGGSGRKRLAVVPKATSHLFFVTIRAGVERAAAEFAVDVAWNGPNDETDHSRQIQIVDAMVTQRVDGIAISATDERALAAPVERAIRAGIPVVVFDSGVNCEGFATFVATGNREAGVTAARKLAELVGGRGKVAMVMQKPGGTSTVLREEGFESTLSSDHKGVKIAARQYCMADIAKARAAAENILTAHPDLAGMFASSEAASLGAIQAVQARGLAGRVKLVTFDTSEQHVAALRAGVIDLMLVQDAERIGYEAVKALVTTLRGVKPPPRIDLPVREVARADLDRPEIVKLLAPQPGR